MDHAPRTGTSPPTSTRVVDVLVPVALDRTYSYRVPRGMELKAGDLVGVPLGPREVLAVVWADNANPEPRLHNRLKDVSEKLDVPPLRSELRSLVDWVANYTLSARGMVLRMCLRMGEDLGPERVRMGVRLAGAPPKRLTPARRRLIEVLSDGLLHGKSEAAKEAGVSVGVVDGLVDEGTLVTEAMPRAVPPPPPDPSYRRPEFTRQQRSAVDAMRALAANGTFHVALLDGVTGSGKTEVYFEAVARALDRRRPNSPDPDARDRADEPVPRPFRPPFWRAPVEWHSELSPANAAASGKASRAARRRSSSARARRCFCPYAISGLIVVDEEHDQAFKQDDRVHYHARDMAVVRGHLAEDSRSCSPPPRHPSRAHVNAPHRPLPPCRAAGAVRAANMPEIEAIDLRRETPLRGLLSFRRAASNRSKFAEQRPAVAAVSQSPRLRAADPLPLLRPSLRLPATALPGSSSIAFANG